MSKYIQEFEIGKKAQDQFIDLALIRGYTVTESTPNQDMFDHIDLFLKKSDKTFSFDVKAMKKINRYDASSQDALVYVEFKNVNGNPGWLYGKADFIAFEKTDSFCVVQRKGLASYCEQNVVREFVDYPRQALYKYYRRSGRKDLISLIEFDRIPKKIMSVWKKVSGD
jgi:hypothetical protein